jgi:hypothetical protein
VPYELPFDWWVRQAGCAEEIIQELQLQAEKADETVRRAMGIKFNLSGGVASFAEPMMVVLLVRSEK